MNRYIALLAVSFASLITYSSTFAWTAPTAAPPGNNVSAPVNIGSADQFKPGVIGANILNVYGASQYLNFGNTTGASGFGLRNNGGTLEYKNSGGSWAAFGGPFIFSGSSVGIGGSPGLKFEVVTDHSTGHAFRLRQSTSGDRFTDIVKRPSTYGVPNALSMYNYDSGTWYHGLSIGPTGNVGVGTEGPGEKLQVMGRVDATSSSGSGGYISSGNYGGTGSAAYFPSGIWSNGGSAWIYGTIYTNGPIVDPSVGTVRDAGGGWMRTYGATGWYSQTYGGGWHMSDTTWIRSYGGHSIYTSGGMRGDAWLATNSLCTIDMVYCASPYYLWYVYVYWISDSRMKENIAPLDASSGLSSLMKLNPVSFDWKDKKMKEKAGPQMGLIAQEVEKIYPGAVQEALDQEIIHEDGTKETVQKPKMVIYQNLVVPLIKSTQELKQENDALKAQLSSLEARLRVLEAAR